MWIGLSVVNFIHQAADIVAIIFALKSECR